MSGSSPFPCLHLVISLVLAPVLLPLPGSRVLAGAVDCEEQALGLQDGRLPDSSLLASSSYPGFEASKARLDHPEGWRASTSDSEQYLRVDLGQETLLTSLRVQGARYGWFPRQVRLFYSLDGLVWVRYLPRAPPDSLPATTRWDVAANVTLDPPLQTRHLAVNPYENVGGPGLRLEIYGCPSNQTTPPRSTPLRSTPVLQDIRDTQVWLPSESPYVVSGPITIRPGAQLTIRPGVRVLFTSENAGLTVMGRLEAAGLQGLPVSMEAPLPALGAGAHWQGLALFQGGSVSLDMVEVRHAQTAVSGTGEQLLLKRSRFFLNDLGLNVTAGSGSLPLEGIMVDRNRLAGMRLDAQGNAIFAVRNSIFFGNGQEGMVVQRSVNLTMDNCTFSGNGGHGLSLSGSSVHLDLTRSAFVGNKRVGLYAYMDWAFFQLNIKSAVVRDNDHEGIFFHFNSARKGSSCVISDSLMAGSVRDQVKLVADGYRDWNYNLTFSGNNVTGPVWNPYYIAIFVYLHRLTEASAVSFTNNRVMNLSRALCFSGSSDRTGYRLEVTNNTFLGMSGNYALKVERLQNPIISGNSFLNNTSPAVVQVASWRSVVTDNVFQNPGATRDLAVVAQGNRADVMDARRNYWGVTRPVDVRSRVCDFYCDLGRPRALLSPYYLDPGLQELSGPRDTEEFAADQDGGLGGLLTSDLTLRPGNQSLRVGSTLVVPRGLTLTLAADLTLAFSPNTGIVVEGTLIVEGEADRKVTLRKSESARWNGIITNSSDVTIRHALIQGAETGLRVDEATSRQSIRLEGVTITDCSFALSVQNVVSGTLSLAVEGSRLLSPVFVDSCRLRLNASLLHSGVLGGGSRSAYVSVGRLDFLMAHSTLNITSGAVSLVVCPLNALNPWAGGGNVSLLNSTVRVSWTWYRPREGLKIVNSFYNATQAAAAAASLESPEDSGQPESMSVLLQGCQLEAQDDYIVWLAKASGVFSSVRVLDSRFRGAHQLLVLDLKTSPATRVLVANSSFLGGDGGSTGALRLTSETFLTRAAELLDNKLVNCSGSVVALGNCRAVLHRNVFLNPGAAYNVRLEKGAPTDEDVNATYNHWGVGDAREVGRRLYDSEYDLTLPKVLYIPFYEDAALRQLLQPESLFLGANSTVGGRVGGNVTLTRAGSPYLVLSSILVDATDRLTIESGVTLLYKPELTLNVKGSMFIRGTADEPVKMLPEENGRKWFGIRLMGQRLPPTEEQRARVRLVGGGDEREGRVEVRRGDAWGTVCDDNFDSADAKVVCAMLGFDPEGGAEAFGSARFGRGEGPIHYGWLLCSGQESHLDQCAHRSYGCGHHEDASVRCLGDRIAPPTGGGRAEVQMENLLVNDTTHGVMVCHNVSRLVNLTSAFSSTYGLHVFYDGSRRPPLHVQGLTVTRSGSHGVRMLGSSGMGAQLVSISGCHIERAGGHGVSLQYSLNLTLENCNITRSSQTGLSATDVAFGHLRLSASSLHANKYAVAVSNTRYVRSDVTIDVSGCNFTSHDTRDRWRNLQSLIKVDVASGNLTVAVRRNAFLGNIARAVGLFLQSDVQVQEAEISDNAFRENQGTAVEVYMPRRVPSLKVERNFLQECATSEGQPLVKLDMWLVSSANISVMNNSFLDNSAWQLLAVTQMWRELPVPVQVQGNRMEGNRGQAALASSTFSLAAYLNLLHNPDMACELAPPPFLSGSRLQATRNAWGVTTVAQVARRTCGFDVNMTRGYVEYLPFLTSLDPVLESSGRHGDFFLPQALGGDVLSELRLDPAASPFDVQRSIFVRSGGQLQVPGDVEMRFAEGAGLFVEGQLHMGDNSGRPTKLSGQSGRPWHGVVLAPILDGPTSPGPVQEGEPPPPEIPVPSRRRRQVSNSTASLLSVSRLVGVAIENAVYGLTLDREAELVGGRVTDSLHSGLVVKAGTPSVLDLGGLTVSGSGGPGVVVEQRTDPAFTLGNLTVRGGQSHGITLDEHRGASFILQDVTLDGNGGSGLNAVSSWGITATLRRCRVLNHSNNVAVFIRENYWSSKDGSVLVTDCHFINNTAGSLTISRDDRYLYNGITEAINVERNVFERDSGVLLETRQKQNVTLSDNVFRDGDAGQSCYVQVTSKVNGGSLPAQQIVLTTNTFQNISGLCVVRLKSEPDGVVNGSFLYNVLESSRAAQAVLLLESPHFNLSHNRFRNPESDYELRVAIRGNGTLPASDNWWGTGDVAVARTRVLDRRQETGLLEVLLLPLLPAPDFDCSQQRNCSHQGECVRPGGCRCQAGWRGDACDQFSCAEVNQCSNHGECMGPNTCACAEGWEGRSCSAATCRNVGNCGNGERGFCVLPDRCRCLPQFSGSNCSQCAPYHWGESCLPCPRCVHGTCDLQRGNCVCSGANWAGPLCDRCAEAYYGADCGAYPTVLHVLPSSSPDTGGVQVHVRGHNFPPAPSGSNYTCRFGSLQVPGDRLGEDHVVCSSPKRRPGWVYLEVSADGQTFTSNKTVFTFIESCPPSACGRGFEPRRGRCNFGDCACNLPWSGPDCDVQLLPPVVSPVNRVHTLAEGAAYSLQLNVTQGEPPITWTLIAGPEGLKVGGANGLVQWAWPVGSDVNHTVEVRAANRLGASTVTWVLHVPITYWVKVDGVEPSEAVLPGPRIMTLRGSVVFYAGVRANITALVHVELRNRERNQTERVEVAPPAIDFRVKLLPHLADTGLFRLDARHPGVSRFEAKVSWEVQALRCVPPVTSVRGYLDPPGQVSFPRLASLLNTGRRPLRNVTARILGLEAPVTSVGLVVDDVTFENGNVIVTSLEPGANVTFDLVMEASRPGLYRLTLEFRSALGTVTGMPVQITAEIRTPLLALNPSRLSASLERGSQQTLQVRVENLGEARASNLRVLLPEGESRLALAAFSADVTDVTDSDVVNDVGSSAVSDVTTPSVLSLGPGESASITLIVTTAPTEPLGELRGSVAVRADSASASLPYVIYVTSSARASLAVRVEDEFTYFAEGAPLVSGAEVTLNNPRRRLTVTAATSNSSGLAEFEDLPEDRYTLTARAPGHAPYTSIILLSPDKPRLTIFMRRVAVQYTWTVTPTTFEDKYVVKLESTFETRVPMPVVTVEPMTVNLLPYELGQNDVMEFVITNHGLIQAENVRFALPTHPELSFEQEGGMVGNLPANTSIVTSIRVTSRASDVSNKRRRRATSGGGSVCGLSVLYDVTCGTARTSSVGVTLTRQYPGSPPQPCGRGSRPGGIPGGGGGGAVFSGSVTYRAVTPLSCDCLKNVFQDCVMAFFPKVNCTLQLATGDSLVNAVVDICLPAFFPVVGCFKSIVDLPGKVGKGGLRGGLWGVLDIGMSCIVGMKGSKGGKDGGSSGSRSGGISDGSGGSGGNGGGSGSGGDGGAADVNTALKCFKTVGEKCGGSRRRRREVNTETITQALDAGRRLTNVIEMVDEVLGDDNMYQLQGRAWLDQLNLAQDPDTPAGALLTSEEVDVIVGTLNDTAQVETLRHFLWRWNSTLAAYQNGTLLQREGTPGFMNYTAILAKVQQTKVDNEAAKRRGYQSVFDYFDGSMKTYNDARRQDNNPGNGVCARVRMRILQELTLTREGFSARLEMDNGEEGALEGVNVTIQIRESISRLPSNHLFSVGALQLEGLTGVGGRGRLERGQRGSAQWLIAPYSTAANVTDTLYDVGGRLQYTVNGQKFDVPLLPDTITVKPNPSLVLHYFHEKFVAGDDAMTPDVIEPSLPFMLAVLVTNQAVGVARAVRITSGQPEIVENEKGLLVSFRITGASVQGGPVSPSLAVTLGDIGPGEARVAAWQLICSLKGKFYNFSATFENINPLGDPQLSIMDSVLYHELIHAVRVTPSHVGSDVSQTPDTLDDFLVNDVIDEEDLPDRLFQSQDGLRSWPVSVANATLALGRQETRGSRTYKHAVLTAACVNVSLSNFTYSRVVNEVTEEVAMETLLTVTRDDGRDVMVGKNAWLTSYFHDKFYFHLFDSVQDHAASQLGQAGPCSVTYAAVFGPVNLHSPRLLNKESLTSPLYVTSRRHSSRLLSLAAHDTDGDDVTFSLSSATPAPFAVDSRSGEVRNTEPLVMGSRFLVTLSATDDGVPPRSDAIDVEIRVGEATGDATTDGVTGLTMPTTTTTEAPPTSEMSTEMTSLVSSGKTSTATDASVTTDSGASTGASVATDGGVATDSGVSTDGGVATDATVATDSGVATDATVATNGGVATDGGVSTDGGVATDATVATDGGVATVATAATDGGVATNGGVVTDAGVSTDATVATDGGVSTDATAATDGGVATNGGVATDAGVSTDATVATDGGVATNATVATDGGVATDATVATDGGVATDGSVTTSATVTTDDGVAANTSSITTNATTPSSVNVNDGGSGAGSPHVSSMLLLLLAVTSCLIGQ